MKVLDTLLEKHFENFKNGLDNLPEISGHGIVLNKIKKTIARAELGNLEYNTMVDYINENLFKNYKDDQIQIFLKSAREKFLEFENDLILGTYYSNRSLV